MLHLLRPVGFIEPCQPTTGLKPPIGPGWIHEIKHDGYRLMAWRTGERVRLLTRNGNDWSEFFSGCGGGAQSTRGPVMPD
jgi:ATP-dependent DNA ligase